jgi:hypothetical protein
MENVELNIEIDAVNSVKTPGPLSKINTFSSLGFSTEN